MAGVPRMGVALLLPPPLIPAPHCPHGPTLLFAKIRQGKEEGRRFYACSACRERKDCSFFQWEDEKVSEARRLAQEKYNQSRQPAFSHAQNVERLHELIKLRSSQEQKSPIRSLLLDIDFRYSQFYTEEEFCHYNMFNHYFFGGEAARGTCQEFLQQEKGNEVIMVADPPFGGLVEALAFAFRQLMAMSEQTGCTDAVSKELPIFWMFPYFFESRILEFFPSFRMLDYQVDYDNHALYKYGKTGRKQSPVRIFTNLSPQLIVLPVEEGYRFCCICQRYVSSENQHCEICNSCTSKDGRRWRHCFLCKTCVKPSWVHCRVCDRCALPSHSCKNTEAGCFVCGAGDHKRTACPQLPAASGACCGGQKLNRKKSKLKANVLRNGKKAKTAKQRKKTKSKKRLN